MPHDFDHVHFPNALTLQLSVPVWYTFFGSLCLCRGERASARVRHSITVFISIACYIGCHVLFSIFIQRSMAATQNMAINGSLLIIFSPTSCFLSPYHSLARRRYAKDKTITNMMYERLQLTDFFTFIFCVFYVLLPVPTVVLDR